MSRERSSAGSVESVLISGLSPSRFRTYLEASGQDIETALHLYTWNIELSAALYEPLHVVEVVLRNALDQQLRSWNGCQRNPATGRLHRAEWLVDPAHEILRLARRDIERAYRRTKTSTQSGQATSHDDILANLSFGTWRFLLPDRHPIRQRLWDEALGNAFPYLLKPPSELTRRVGVLYRLRNRIAHLEPIIRRTVIQGDIQSIRFVLKAIDPAWDEWVMARQRVTYVLRHDPRLRR